MLRKLSMQRVAQVQHSSRRVDIRKQVVNLLKYVYKHSGVIHFNRGLSRTGNCKETAVIYKDTDFLVVLLIFYK